MNKIAFPNHTIIIIKRKDDHNDIKGKERTVIQDLQTQEKAALKIRKIRTAGQGSGA